MSSNSQGLDSYRDGDLWHEEENSGGPEFFTHQSYHYHCVSLHVTLFLPCDCVFSWVAETLHIMQCTQLLKHFLFVIVTQYATLDPLAPGFRFNCSVSSAIKRFATITFAICDIRLPSTSTSRATATSVNIHTPSKRIQPSTASLLEVPTLRAKPAVVIQTVKSQSMLSALTPTTICMLVGKPPAFCPPAVATAVATAAPPATAPTAPAMLVGKPLVCYPPAATPAVATAAPTPAIFVVSIPPAVNLTLLFSQDGLAAATTPRGRHTTTEERLEVSCCAYSAGPSPEKGPAPSGLPFNGVGSTGH